MTKERSLNGGNDEYFTPPELVKKCYNQLFDYVDHDKFVFLEPSAGAGAFISDDLDMMCFDLNPKRDDIIKQDFLKLEKSMIKSNRSIIAIGNPPFGFASTLAIKFFNHCAEEFKADYIAFIVPRTFMKESIHNRLNLNYHLIHNWIIPDKESNFEIDEGYKFVPCVFQIWIRNELSPRTIKEYHSDAIEFVKTQDEADICIRRVGGRSGQIIEGDSLSPSSTYFIKINESWVMDVFQNWDLSNIINNTAGVKSLSKDEIYKELIKYQ